MNCVRCGRDTNVLDTRMVDFMLRRRRQCSHCGHRFSTYEVDDGYVKTIKKHFIPHQKAISKRVALTQRNERIIERLKQGFKHSAVAAEFGLCDSMISTIARKNKITSYRSRK